VQVPLAVRYRGPGGAAEPGGPVVRRLAAVWSSPSAEDEQLALGAPRLGRKRLLEERMLRRAVVRDYVDDDPYAVVFRDLDQMIKVAQRAKTRVDVHVVADVIAAVVERRRIEGRQPDRVDAEGCQVWETADKTGQVTVPVPVVVREAARVHLVHHRAGPPGVVV